MNIKSNALVLVGSLITLSCSLALHEFYALKYVKALHEKSQITQGGVFMLAEMEKISQGILTIFDQYSADYKVAEKAETDLLKMEEEYTQLEKDLKNAEFTFEAPVDPLFASWKNLKGTLKDLFYLLKTFRTKGDLNEVKRHLSKVHDSLGQHIRKIAQIVETEKKHMLEEEQRAKSEIRLKFITMLLVLVAGLFLVMTLFLTTLSTLSKNFRKAIADLVESSTTIKNVSKEAATSSDTFSSNVMQQASAIQQTSAAVEELSAMVRKNLENSESSIQIAKNSQDTVANGKRAVNEMITAMKEIDDSNASILNVIEKNGKNFEEIIRVILDISNKTKVINDIVFQTKLLSFNAAVEAARAGEHGKGFALVAQEVGKLAQMSGSSAKEISVMVEESVRRVESIVKQTEQEVKKVSQIGKEKVSRGKNITLQCEAILNEIVSSVSSISGKIVEISAACREQSLGNQEITRAMLNLDQVTRANADSSQKAAQSSVKLSERSDGLLSIANHLSTLLALESSSSASPGSLHEASRLIPQVASANRVKITPKPLENSSQKLLTKSEKVTQKSVSLVKAVPKVLSAQKTVLKESVSQSYDAERIPPHDHPGFEKE